MRQLENAKGVGSVWSHTPLLLVALLLCFIRASGQNQQQTIFGVESSPAQSEGLPIRAVQILLTQNGKTYLSDSLETQAFYDAFHIKPGAQFSEKILDLALVRMRKEPIVKGVTYKLYTTEFLGPLTLVITVDLLSEGETKQASQASGTFSSQGWKDFPVLFENDRAKVLGILNAAVGVYHEQNAFFGQGARFTQGNPVANNPAGYGPRFWGEFNAEPGIAAISKLGQSKWFAYGAVSYMVTGRNTSDIYSEGPAAFGAVERLYGGLLGAGLGAKKALNLSVSYGRQFFQLNDGFLFAKFSGSANAGPRASVYLNSRTTFEKAGLLKMQWRNWTLDGYFLEPQELFTDRQTNTQYAGGQINWNNNKTYDVGVNVAAVPHSKVAYRTPLGTIPKEGLWLINPKFWLNNLWNQGIYLKSEYVYQSSSAANIQAQAWYVGLGIRSNKVPLKPGLYYRFAWMQGDDSTTSAYERFDPLLTGGLGNWVQGINFRKVVGNGNIITHRIEAKMQVSSVFELSLDYFHLRAQSLSNLGGLAPIARLKSVEYGQEVTLTARYFLNKHFMLLGVFSYGQPGTGLQLAFEDPLADWWSFQTSLFMFF
jgi:hypothetical protein